MEFILKQETVKRNQVTAFHIIAALLLFVMGFITLITPFSLNIFLAGKEKTEEVPFGIVNMVGGIFMIIGLLITIVSIFFNKRYMQHRNNLIIRIVEIICFAAIFIYCMIQQWYLPAAYSGVALLGIILAYFLENAKYRVTTITLGEDGVNMKNNIKNTLWRWNQLNQFRLKHNVITLQTTEAKMFQFIIEKNETQDITAANQMALEKITENIPNRNKDNW